MTTHGRLDICRTRPKPHLWVFAACCSLIVLVAMWYLTASPSPTTTVALAAPASLSDRSPSMQTDGTAGKASNTVKLQDAASVAKAASASADARPTELQPESPQQQQRPGDAGGEAKRPDSDAGAARQPELLDLGWPGFVARCLDTVPSNSDLQDSPGNPGLVEITYRICCSIGADDGDPRSSCKSAPKALLVPRAAAEMVRAAGDRTTDLASLNPERSFVFMTGASENHYRESLVLIRIIQQLFPNRTILYWDFGLTAEQADGVRTFCSVKYRRFDFSKYPEHVRTLTTYAFKPLAIMESLAEYPLIWWVDASIRFTADHLQQGLAMLKQRHGLVMFHDPGHSVWSTTYPQMFEYIATDEAGLQRTVTCTGASFIVSNTRELFSTFLYWLYACVLDIRCIAPITYPGPCNLKGPAVFANCHRFDQSLMTILAANFWGFGSDNYRFQHDYFHLERSPDGRDDVRRCLGKE